MSAVPPTGVPANTAITLVILSCTSHTTIISDEAVYCWEVEAKLSAAGDSVMHRCFIAKNGEDPPTAEMVALKVLEDLVGDR